MDVFVSTSGIKHQDAVSRAFELVNLGVRSIELSDGIPLTDTNFSSIFQLSQHASTLLHNYFPPPVEPFVLNLASTDLSILERSKDLLKQSILLTEECGSQFFSFHSGFLCDPPIRSLGGSFPKENLLNRNRAIEIFASSCQELLDFARQHSVIILVENNVVTKSNINSHNENPFLLADPKEIAFFLSQFNGQIGLLLDIGHWKVSAHSLGFQFDSVSELKQHVIGLHVHTNDGLGDQHHMISKSEFSLFSDLDPEYVTIEAHIANPKDLVSHYFDVVSWR